MAQTVSDPRYPVGPFVRPESITPDERIEAVATLAELPEKLRNAVDGLNSSQLSTPYRDGGWTLRQVVHHVADSHMNSYIRVKLALTENDPTISAYDEAAWAKLPDSGLPVEVSLALTGSVHIRLVSLFEAMSDDDFGKTFRHPERGPVTLANNLALYAWHSHHHTAHITRLRERMGW